ncbi:dTDP-4-dehydrorhamnose 3,5-epimerase family protein [Candidatus Pseudothioglobus singularis]|nr:dTDP-4-dehydrorhamnose 3,5-epimerase family protein [Candidatus Pseudothioglobus singularis]
MNNNISLNNIEGVYLSELKQIPDERGSVLHMMRNDEEIFKSFGEIYFSEVFPGAVKAWKFHHAQTQNFAVPIGRMCVVIYDDRKNSLTHGNIQVIELGRPDLFLRLTIPPKLWYGFTCISETSALLANCADLPYDANESIIKPADDKSIPYKWNHD